MAHPARAQVTVVRDGQRREVGSGELLVGDIMLLATGDILPADGMLFEGVDIRRACGPSAWDRALGLTWHASGAPTSTA